MKEINRHLADIDGQLTHIKNHLQQLDDCQHMIVLVLGWLLAKHPGDEALRALSRLANDLDEDSDLVHHVELLDQLRNHIMELHASWKEDNHVPMKENKDN